MKAAHMKLLSEVQERELQLAQVTQAQQKMLEQQRSASRIHQIDRTKLEVTIDQQAKLIDYLHGPSGPQSTTKRKKACVLWDNECVNLFQVCLRLTTYMYL